MFSQLNNLFDENLVLDMKRLHLLQSTTQQYYLKMAAIYGVQPNIGQINNSIRSDLSFAIRSKSLKIVDILLTPSNSFIVDSVQNRNKFLRGGYSIVDNVVTKEMPLVANYIEQVDTFDWFNVYWFEDEETIMFKRLLREYRAYVAMTPFRSPSTTTHFVRNLFTGIADLHQVIRQVHHRQMLQYRFDILIGTKLENIETGEVRNFYPAPNSSLFYEEVKPLINLSIRELLERITLNSIIEKLNRPNSKWKLICIYEYIILITAIPETLIGCTNANVSEYIKLSKSVIALENIENNLCFWYCLQLFYTPEARLDRIANVVKQRFRDFYGKSKSVKNYSGVSEKELDAIEQHFQICINVYDIYETHTKMITHSEYDFNDILSVNMHGLYSNHFSFIKNIHNITRSFMCSECNTFIAQTKNLKRHWIACKKGKVEMEFKYGDYETKSTIFDDLDNENIHIPNNLRFYPNFLIYDIETYLNKYVKGDPRIMSAQAHKSVANTSKQVVETPKKISTLCFEGEHEILSISVRGNQDASTIFIPVDSTSEEAVEKMIVEMESIRMKYIEEMYKTYMPYFESIRRIACKKDDNKRFYLMNDLVKWIEEMPVYGFNSSGYDLNVLKRHLPAILMRYKTERGNFSKKEKQWLKLVEQGLGRKLQHQFKIQNYTVDAYDKQTNTVYEFQGCFFHGCNKCYPAEKVNALTGDTMGVLLKRTLKRETFLKNQGYKLVTQWECDFKDVKEEVIGILKQNNRYRMISNGQFVFKDITSYLAPGYSLDDFLKAFDTKIPKGIFCHKVTQNVDLYFKENPDLVGLSIIDMLRKSPIPSKKWFYNDLKCKSISDDDYNYIKLKYSNIYDLLEDYNNADVEPTIEATTKLIKFYADKELDMHKDGISVSGLALKYLWKVKDPNCLPTSKAQNA